MIDIQEKKNKIIEFLNTNGPSLPVQVARSIQMDPVFASAILSELINEKAIKTSNIRVGASPLYLIPGQEEKLEQKTEHLKSIEKETQERLKSKKIIIDENEEPATRVALRNLKDFAIPFKLQEKIAWKYAFASQEEIDKILSKTKSETSKKETTPEKKKQPEQKNEKKIENIFKEPREEPKKKEPQQKTFLKKIEKFLANQNTSITAIEEVDKKKVIATIESNNSLSMLFAFNKIRIDENELLKCYKLANKVNLPYQIIIKGKLTKKLTNTILAHQKLLRVDKLEE